MFSIKELTICFYVFIYENYKECLSSNQSCEVIEIKKDTIVNKKFAFTYFFTHLKGTYMHDIYKQKCLVKSIYLVLQIKHCKKVRSSIGFNRSGTNKQTDRHIAILLLYSKDDLSRW